MYLRDMEELVHSVVDPEMKDYMREAMSCYSAGAYRGTIVLSCIALFDDLARKIEGLKHFNSDAKALGLEIQKRRDDQKIFESYLLDQLASKGIISQLDGTILSILRDLRNKSAHPSSHRPTAEEARWVFSEVIGRVLSKKELNTRVAAEQLLDELKGSNFFPHLSQESIQSVVSSSLTKLHKSSYCFLIVQLVQRARDNDENATRFLWGMAMQRSDELRGPLHDKCVQKLAVHSENTGLMVAMTCADAALWLHGEHETHDRLDQLILTAFRDETRPLVKVCGVPLSPHNLLASLLPHREDTHGRFEYLMNEKGILERFFSEPEVSRICLADAQLRVDYLQWLLRHAGSSTFTDVQRVATLGELDQELAQYLSPEECLKLLHALSRAAENGSYVAKDLVSEDFAAFPEVVRRAEGAWETKKDEVEDWPSLMSSYKNKIMKRLESVLGGEPS